MYNFYSPGRRQTHINSAVFCLMLLLDSAEVALHDFQLKSFFFFIIYWAFVQALSAFAVLNSLIIWG